MVPRSAIETALAGGPVVQPLKKVVIFDSCSFFESDDFGKRLAIAGGYGLLIGFKEDIDAFDSLLLEAGLLNWLLYDHEVWYGQQDGGLPGEFWNRYRGLASVLGLVAYSASGRRISSP